MPSVGRNVHCVCTRCRNNGFWRVQKRVLYVYLFEPVPWPRVRVQSRPIHNITYTCISYTVRITAIHIVLCRSALYRAGRCFALTRTVFSKRRIAPRRIFVGDFVFGEEGGASLIANMRSKSVGT